MAYDTANFGLFMQPMSGPRMWIYDAKADAQAAIRVNNFFSDAHKKGVKAKDFVLVQYDSFTASIHTFNSVKAADGTGNNDLTDGLAVAATDTD
jgi:hypothetical protein